MTKSTKYQTFYSPSRTKSSFKENKDSFIKAQVSQMQGTF